MITKKLKNKLVDLNRPNSYTFEILLAFICILSFGFSYIEAVFNIDGYHWGFVYEQALDLKKGLIPHKDTFIFYGYLTSWVQGLSLSIFGERLISLGIITGLFYSFSLLLSYTIFLKFVPKYLAFLATLLIFLIHGYVYYPWSNYYSYSFHLISILFFLKSLEQHKYWNLFYSGLFLGISVLFRYSSLPLVLLPYLMFLGYTYLITKEQNKLWLIARQSLILILGLYISIGLFLLYLISQGALQNFLIQLKMPAEIVGATQLSTLVNFAHNLFTFKYYSATVRVSFRDMRTFLFLLIFIWNFLVLLYFLHLSLLKKRGLSNQEKGIILICLITLIGYLNAIHYYNIFRLINSASLGFGTIAYTLLPYLSSTYNRAKFIIVVLFTTICIILANTLLFSQNSHIIDPWTKASFTKQIVIPSELSIMQGKRVPKAYYDHYLEIKKILSNFDASYYAIFHPDPKLTLRDPILVLLEDHLKKPQLSTIQFRELNKAYPQKTQEIQQLIKQKKAVVFSLTNPELEGYKTIKLDRDLEQERIWTPARIKVTYISIPIINKYSRFN